MIKSWRLLFEGHIWQRIRTTPFLLHYPSSFPPCFPLLNFAYSKNTTTSLDFDVKPQEKSMFSIRVFAGTALLIALAAFPAFGQLQVISVTPTGEVQSSDQAEEITVTSSEPVIALSAVAEAP